MPNHIEKSPEEIAEHWNLPVPIIEHILETFSEITLKNQSKINSSNDSEHTKEFKYVKSKENTRMLMCHIIAIIGIVN